MDTYDESQDIDALLRSSLSGEQTNPPRVGGGVAGSAETSARRRRIRFDIDSLDGGQPLSDQQQSELERAAMLSATIPDSSKQPIPSKESARIDTDLWRDCARSSAAQRRLTGTVLT